MVLTVIVLLLLMQVNGELECIPFVCLWSLHCLMFMLEQMCKQLYAF